MCFYKQYISIYHTLVCMESQHLCGHSLSNFNALSILLHLHSSAILFHGNFSLFKMSKLLQIPLWKNHTTIIWASPLKKYEIYHYKCLYSSVFVVMSFANMALSTPSSQSAFSQWHEYGLKLHIVLAMALLTWWFVHFLFFSYLQFPGLNLLVFKC